MATVFTGYPSSANRTTQAENIDWDTAHDAATGTILTNYDTPNFLIDAGSYLAGGNHFIWRGLLDFDTSSISSSAVISSGTLQLYVQTSAGVTGTDPIHVSQGVQGIPVVVANYGDQLTETTSGGSQGSMAVGAYRTITLNASGLGFINKGGTTKLCIRGDIDLGDETPGGVYNNYIWFYSVQKGGDFRPLLTLSYNVLTVTTQTCEDVVGATATGRGNITSLAGTITAHGHCWAETVDPTTANSKVDNGAASATGAFTSAITGLTPNTGYYTRAYATNEIGTFYGENIYFVPPKTGVRGRAGYVWMEGSNLHGFDENAVERQYIHTDDVDDTPVNGATEDPISSNWAFDHVAAADPHVGYVLESLFDAQTILQATSDDTPTALTVTEQTVVGRQTGGNIAAIPIGITDDDIVEIDDADVADNDYAKFTTAGLEGRSYSEVLSDLSGQASAAFDWNSQALTETGTITAATSVWHHEHDLFATSLNPGASGATRTAPNSNTLGGWQLDASGETLYFEAHMEAEWDASSDLIINAWWEVNVDNTGGAGGDTVDLRLVVRYKGEGETAIKTQTVEVATTVGASAQYKQFKTSFTIDYDAASNVINSLDLLSFAINLETDTSEVDDIILNLMELRYPTTKPSLEA